LSLEKADLSAGVVAEANTEWMSADIHSVFALAAARRDDAGLFRKTFMTSSSVSSSGPLAGLRVLDLTSVLMGPFATLLLGDMGAEIIKVEPPAGDSTRKLGPMRNAGMGALFLHCNRNKRSIVLDLKKAEGRDALLRLAATVDALVHNVRPQAMRRLRLSYEDVAAVRPDIVYAGLHGFDQRGPYAARPAYDDLIQGAAAIPALSVLAGGDAPRYAPGALADRIVGIAAANVVLSALFHRQRTGEGQAIEVPMFETMVQLTLGDHMGGRTFEPPIGPTGYSRILNPHRRPYRTLDGYICVLFYTDRQWQSFFTLTGCPERFFEHFDTIGRRMERITELYAMVADAMAKRSTAEWLEVLAEADIPHMPMHTVDSLLEDPHLDACGFFVEQQHPSEGAIRTMRVPARWSKTQPQQRSFAPRLGEHGDDVLREAGFSAAELARLRDCGALGRVQD